MRDALYGPAGFFTTTRPSAHFRTSAQTATFARALRAVLDDLDATLAVPTLDVVDVGAGGGELLTALSDAPEHWQLTGVDLASRPPGLPDRVAWRHDPPESLTGLLVATEWLDNVPLDVAECDEAGVPRLVLVDDDGAETLGAPVDDPWLDRWWPLTVPGTRAEIGEPRDTAWSDAVRRVRRGLAVAVDYGHVATTRPPYGTLAGYRDGREVAPVPDGSRDLTAHVAWDPLLAGARLLTQRDALRALGVSGTRPPLALAHTDPAGYLRALSAASEAGELTDRGGLGGHHWLVHPVGTALPAWVTGSGT